MRKTVFIFLVLLGVMGGSSEASTRSDVKIIEASENIRYLSQKIAKEYLYLYYNPKKINLKEKIKRSMEKLKDNIHTIAINTQNDESKNIINFLTYTNEEIQLLLFKEASDDRGILILDYSETFVEAANSIQDLHQYRFSEEERMLMYLKELEYLLERVNKYYMASIMNLNKMNNARHMQSAISKIKVILTIIKNYPYPEKIKEEQIKMVNYWRTNKNFLNISAKISVPNLLLISTKNFKTTIQRLELYHKQNQ